MLADPQSRLHQIWGLVGWRVRGPGMMACWETFEPSDEAFFEDAENGTTCVRNWYEGNPGPLGFINGGPNQSWVEPHFTQPAPALLGFDESIDWFCNKGWGSHSEKCTHSNYNILSLYWPVRTQSLLQFRALLREP